MKNKIYIATKIRNLCRAEMIRSVAALFSSNLMFAVVGVIVSLIQGKFIVAEDLGYFGQFGIYSSYLFLLHLGVFQAVERLVPYYFGNKEYEKAKKIVQVGEAWILMVCFPIILTFSILSLIAFVNGNWKAGLGWFAQIFVIITQLYSGYIKATYRSGQDFRKLAKNQIYTPIMYLLCLPLYWIQPYVALFSRTISTVVSDIIIFHSRPFRAPPHFDVKLFWEMISQGFPLFVSSYILNTGLLALQSTLIVKLLGYSELGYWTFANIVITYARYLPNAITAVFMPKIIQKYGETHSLKVCLKETRKPLYVSFFVSFCIAVVGGIMTIKLLPLILPNYTGAKKLICIMLIGMPFYSVNIQETVLTATKKIVSKIIFAAGNASVQIIVALFLYVKGLGTYSFAIGLVAGYILEMVMINIYFQFRKEKGE